MDILDLSDFFTTKSQAADFSARLSEISTSLYEVGLNLEDILQKQFGIKKKDKFLTLLRENKIPLNSNLALNNFIAKIQKVVSELPVATLTLAIEPEKQTFKTISSWFLLNLKQQVLIETQLDPNIIAGAIVGYKGKQLNTSIKQVFDEVCAASLTENNHKTSDIRQQVKQGVKPNNGD